MTNDRPRATKRAIGAWRAAALLLVSACSALGPPPMEPLTHRTLEAARHRWRACGSDSYHVVVRVRPPRADPAVYDLVVADGEIVEVARDGQEMRPEDARDSDYSVSGLFDLLRTDLRWTDLQPIGDTPAVDLRARFEPETGRLVRYRRTVGTARRRVLMIEVLSYEPTSTTPRSNGTGLRARTCAQPAAVSRGASAALRPPHPRRSA